MLAGDSRLQPAVVRLKANGALDTTFDGDGKKLFSWGAIGRVTAVVVAPNGKILLGGFSGPEGGNIQVARMKANGALDTTFGTGGIATVDFGGTEFGEAMARQADGRILVAGRSSAGGAVVARLRATGVLDPDFGGDGRVTLPGGGSLSAVLVQPDRNIVVAGNANGSATMTVTRLRPDGSLDATFGTGGTTTVAFGSLANPLGGAARQPNGKIVIAGYTQDGEDVAVARLNANGSLDPGFGVGGQGDRRVRDGDVRQRGRAVAERADRRRRPEDGRRRLRCGAPAGLTTGGQRPDRRPAGRVRDAARAGRREPLHRPRLPAGGRDDPRDAGSRRRARARPGGCASCAGSAPGSRRGCASWSRPARSRSWTSSSASSRPASSASAATSG